VGTIYCKRYDLRLSLSTPTESAGRASAAGLMEISYLQKVEVKITRHYNILLSTTEYVAAQYIKRSYRGIKEKHKTL